MHSCSHTVIKSTVYNFFPSIITFRRNTEESKQMYEEQSPSKYTMIPKRDMIDDCYFRNASDIPTIVNVIMYLGKSTDCVDVDSVKKFTDRNF